LDQAFVIMRIGDSDLDRIYQEVLVPTIEKCGLVAKRVDKHNEGGLLKSEIIQFINESSIIIADLTDERPNCYLEVGYTMGINKFKNLILTARNDHNQDHPSHKPGGPKIHFDLSGYDILYWNPDDLQEFSSDLERRIKRRLSVISREDDVAETYEQFYDWINENRDNAIKGLAKADTTAYMEAYFFPLHALIQRSQKELLSAATVSQIQTFEFPIAAVFPNDDIKPIPVSNGIRAEIPPLAHRSDYHYWTIHSNGSFYMAEGLFEDMKSEEHVIFYNTRIVKVAEAFLYCNLLSKNLGYDGNTRFRVGIKHFGLEKRRLSAIGRLSRHRGVSTENEISGEIEIQLNEIDDNLVFLVKNFIEPLLILFDYFELSNVDYEDIINKIINGRVI